MRIADWPTALAEFLKDKQHAEFKWGENDCCLFAADAIKTITQVDNATEFRGRYTTALGAARALKRYGAGDIKSTFTAKFGEPKGRLGATRGDIALVNVNDEDIVGVVFGDIYVLSDIGLTTLPLSRALCVWSIV